jgi:hypothetical protein
MKRPQSGTGILPVSVSEADTSLTHHRLEACATNFAKASLDKSPRQGRGLWRKPVKPMVGYWVLSGVFSTAFLRVTSAITMCIHP